jgi:uncharacterized protein (TIGR02466 family)
MSPTRQLFPTQVYIAPLKRGGLGAFNRQILKESMQLRADDRAGRLWSRTKYPGGYTSYGSQCQLQRISPTFAALERYLAPHLKKFTADLAFEMRGRALVMTDCWVNIMPRGVVHSLHLHPVSTISGTYYVQVPAGASGLKFEDPRLDRFMASPPRKASAPAALRPWHTVPAKVGQVVLFESWLRHEVPPNPAGGERVSISFNFNWF